MFLAALWGERDDACRLSHAVGFRDVVAAATLMQALVDAFLESRVQDIASHIDGFQVREVFFDLFFLVDEIPIGRHREDVLRLVLGQEFQEFLARCDRDDDDAHAIVQGKHQGVGSKESKDGQDAERGVVARNVVENWWVGEHGVHNVLSGEHHAFHCSRGAAGLEQGSHLVGNPMVWLGLVWALCRLVKIFPMAEFLMFPEHLSPSVEPLAYAKPERGYWNGIGTRTHHDFLNVKLGIGGSQAGRVETHDKQHLGVCPVDDFAKLFGRISDINHARDSADFVQCQETHQRLGHGRQSQTNDVATFHPMFSESQSRDVNAFQ